MTQPDFDKKIVSLNMMKGAVRSTLESMKILHSDKSFPSWLLSYYLLATINLEVCGKVILFTEINRSGKYSDEQIRDELKKFGHNLETIYSNRMLTNLCAKTNISDVKLIVGDSVYRYNFSLSNHSDPLYIYDSESIRYGLLTEKQNHGFVAYQTDEVLKLCESVYQETNDTNL